MLLFQIYQQSQILYRSSLGTYPLLTLLFSAVEQAHIYRQVLFLIGFSFAMSTLLADQKMQECLFHFLIGQPNVLALQKRNLSKREPTDNYELDQQLKKSVKTGVVTQD